MHQYRNKYSYQHNAICDLCEKEISNQETVVLLECRHFFHMECFDEMVQKKKILTKCPKEGC